MIILDGETVMWTARAIIGAVLLGMVLFVIVALIYNRKDKI